MDEENGANGLGRETEILSPFDSYPFYLPALPRTVQASGTRFLIPPKLSTRIPRVRTRSTANERVIPLYAILDELVVLAPHTSPLFPSRPRYEIELI